MKFVNGLSRMIKETNVCPVAQLPHSVNQIVVSRQVLNWIRLFRLAFREFSWLELCFHKCIYSY